MVNLTNEENELISSVYFNPSHPAGYSSPSKIYIALGKRVSLGKIKKFLQTIESYTVLKQVKRKFEKTKVVSPYIDYMWDADTANMTFYEKKDEKMANEHNDGYRYFLVVIDVFSRFLWTKPLKTLKADETKDALIQLLRNRKPDKLRTDLGSEFHNKKVNGVLKTEEIDHILTLNEGKANYAERVIQTIKNRMGRYLEEKETYRWIDVLPQITDSYNNTYHRSIRMKPTDVTQKDEINIWRLNYENIPKPKVKRKPQTKRKKYSLNIGDYVRLSGYKHPFDKTAFSHSWTTELFIIVNRRTVAGLSKYKVIDYGREDIRGEFYEKELQKVYITDNPLFKIDRVIKRRTRNKRTEYFVKFKSWPKKYNAWVEDVDDIK